MDVGPLVVEESLPDGWTSSSRGSLASVAVDLQGLEAPETLMATRASKKRRRNLSRPCFNMLSKT